MKKSNFINKLWAVCCCVLLAACEGTFVPDPLDPRLPKYTEEGNNVAGAFVNNEIWESKMGFFIYTYDEPYIEIAPKQNIVSVKFYGHSNNTSASFEFELKDLNIKKVEDLVSLSGKKITIGENKNRGYYNLHSKETYASEGTGQIYFKHIERKGEKNIQLSGTFGFTAKNKEGKTLKITFGRFDYITTIHFFDRENVEKEGSQNN